MLQTAEIPLASMSKGGPQAPWVRFYIEGDGRAFTDAEHISPNPTPLNPVALALARQDSTAPQVIYLARPGQYGTSEALARWWWSDGRFSPRAVNLYRKTIHTLAAGRPVELVGYSGGGGIAMAVGYYAAEDKTPITHITTLAGNLNPQQVNQAHKVAPFAEIDPAFGQTVPIPQHHWVGQNDTVVPLAITEELVKKETREGVCASVRKTEATHGQGWPPPGWTLPPSCAKRTPWAP